MNAPESFRDLYDRLFPEWTVFVPPHLEAQARAVVEESGVQGVTVRSSPYLPEGQIVAVDDTALRRAQERERERAVADWRFGGAW